MPSRLTPIEAARPCIALATPADAAALAALYAAALPPGWPSHELAAACADANRTVLKASDVAGLQGFLILQYAADEAEILGIAVANGYRRRGLAASLLRQGISLCQSRIISCIYLEVAESNKPARGLYEKFDFAEIGRRHNYYLLPRSASPPETAIVMRRDANLPVPVDLEKSCT